MGKNINYFSVRFRSALFYFHRINNNQHLICLCFAPQISFVQVKFSFSCAMILLEPYYEGDERFKCTLHKDCGYLVHDNERSIIGKNNLLPCFLKKKNFSLIQMFVIINARKLHQVPPIPYSLCTH